MNVTVFEAINITKKYRNTLALNQVSMSVMQGDIYGFIGENGAGKTTMIRLLTGLAEPTTGKIALFGESNKKLAKQRERIGCIIESPSLYLDMTAYENLEVQRLQRGIPGKGCIANDLLITFFSSRTSFDFKYFKSARITRTISVTKTARMRSEKNIAIVLVIAEIFIYTISFLMAIF